MAGVSSPPAQLCKTSAPRFPGSKRRLSYSPPTLDSYWSSQCSGLVELLQRSAIGQNNLSIIRVGKPLKNKPFFSPRSNNKLLFFLLLFFIEGTLLLGETKLIQFETNQEIKKQLFFPPSFTRNGFYSELKRTNPLQRRVCLFFIALLKK